MQIEGVHEIARPPSEVFRQLFDPVTLRRCIPGCESVLESEDGFYAVKVTAGVGSVRGSFDLTIAVSDVVEPEAYRLSLEGRSRIAHVRGEAFVRLEPVEGGSRLHYEGDAHVGGPIAAVGQRLLQSVARRLTGDFFGKLTSEVGEASG